MYEKKIYLTEDMLKSMRQLVDDIVEGIIHKSILDLPINTMRHPIRVTDLKDEAFMPFREVKKVIFNAPATVIIWSDETKTVVKCEDGETYDKEKGFLLCWLKGIKGSKKLQKELAKWIYPED